MLFNKPPKGEFKKVYSTDKKIGAKLSEINKVEMKIRRKRIKQSNNYGRKFNPFSGG